MKLQVFKLVVLTVSALACNVALGEYTTNYSNVDVSRWKCFLCEFQLYQGTTGQISVASVLTTDDSDRFGRNGSFESAGTRTVLDGGIDVNRASGWLFSASATNIGLASNDIAIEIKNSRSLKANLRFQQYRRLAESNALTPFQASNSGLTLGPQWQRDLQSSGFTSLGSTNRRLELATTRRLLESTVSMEVVPRIELSLSHKSASKEGTRETFRDGIFQSTALPKTIDHESVTNRIQISYRDQRLNTTWSRSDSTFKNLVPLLQWESPYRFGLMKNESANAFSHDHSSETLDIKLSLPRNGVLRIHERRGETETEPQSLRYGFSSLINDVEPVHLFAKRDYVNRRLVVTNQLSRNIDISASHLQYELKNFRPVEELTPALGGLFLVPSRTLRSGDFKRQESEIGLNYRPLSGLRVLSRIWEFTFTRTNQEIAENQTQGGELKITQPLLGRWETFASVQTESRNASDFQVVTTNNPNTRRFHQAEMERRIWSTGLTFSARERDDFISVTVDLDRRNYPASELGLSDEEFRGLTLSYGLRIGESIGTDGYVASHRRSASINGSQSLDLSMPWSYSSDDIVNSAGLNLAIEPLNKFVDNIHVVYSLSDGEAKLETIFSDAARFFPRQISRHESVDVSIGFGEIFGVSVEARVYFETYEARDWSIDNVDQTTLASVLTMARDNPSYDNTLFSLLLKRSL